MPSAYRPVYCSAPKRGTSAPTAGIAWATDTNELAMLGPTGAALLRRQTTAEKAGIARLGDELTRPWFTEVAVERPLGPIVDALSANGIRVSVIPP